MKNLFSTLLALAVASVTGTALAQAPAAQNKPAAQQAPAGGAKSIEARVAMCMGCHNIKGYQASFDGVIAHFVDCLETGAAFETNPVDNLETLRLVEHAYWAAGLQRARAPT